MRDTARGNRNDWREDAFGIRDVFFSISSTELHQYNLKTLSSSVVNVVVGVVRR